MPAGLLSMARRRLRASSLADQVDALARQLQAVEQQRSPLLWNDVEEPIGPGFRTAVEAVGAAAPGEAGVAAALDAAMARFDGCVQGPLLRGMGPERVDAMLAADRLPVPPPEARERYFEGDDAAYWVSGLGDRLLLEDVGRTVGRELGPGRALLDFGCSSGRVLRHFAGQGMRLFGVDIGRHAVDWARMHLGPGVTIAQGTLIPHLPFPDASLDCVYAGSVFTHIADFEEAWLLELRRVLAPGGFALLTFHSDRVWEELAADPGHYLRGLVLREGQRLDPGGVEPVGPEVLAGPMPAERVVFTLTTAPINNANVFHSRDWVRERWGRWFELRSIIERAHATYQDAAVLVRTRST